jgi:hypothetical protein
MYATGQRKPPSQSALHNAGVVVLGNPHDGSSMSGSLQLFVYDVCVVCHVRWCRSWLSSGDPSKSSGDPLKRSYVCSEACQSSTGFAKPAASGGGHGGGATGTLQRTFYMLVMSKADIRPESRVWTSAARQAPVPFKDLSAKVQGCITGTAPLVRAKPDVGVHGSWGGASEVHCVLTEPASDCSWGQAMT